MADETETTEVEEETTETEESEALGDAGKKALDAMKAQRLAARKDRDAARKERDAALAELAKLKAGADEKHQIDEKAIRESARKDAEAAVVRERAMDRVEAKAAKLFADPEDARALLASKVEDFIDDGHIDNEAIAAALADLLQRKPHLGAQGGGKRFEGSGDGGKGTGTSGVKQLTEADLKKMTPLQIVEAQEKGQLNDLMGIKT